MFMDYNYIGFKSLDKFSKIPKMFLVKLLKETLLDDYDSDTLCSMTLLCHGCLKGQYRHNQSRLSTGNGIGVRVQDEHSD